MMISYNHVDVSGLLFNIKKQDYDDIVKQGKLSKVPETLNSKASEKPPVVLRRARPYLRRLFSCCFLLLFASVLDFEETCFAGEIPI